MPCVVAGYDEAVAEERTQRSIPYLNAPEIVLGETLNNITPHLLAVLTAIQSPFYLGGPFTHAHVAQFLWALHRDYQPRGFKSWWNRRRIRRVVSRFTLDRCREEIGAFIDLTFMDMPTGGREEKPIASSIAWLVYRFRCEPFRQPKIITLHTPLRDLYQELRCWMREQDQDVPNRSDKFKATWIEQINEGLRTGVITQAQLDAWNAKHKATRERN